MTVQELMIVLGNLPPRAHVFFPDGEAFREITEAEIEHTDARTDSPMLRLNAPKGPQCVVLR